MTKRLRKDEGAALLSVLLIGASSVIFLLGLASIVTNAVKVSAGNKWIEGLRNAAEIGVEYTVDKFNSISPCPLDPQAPGSLITTLSPTELQTFPTNGVTPNPGVPNVKVTIKVTRLSSADFSRLAAFSSVYSHQLDPTNSQSQGWARPASTNITASTGGGYRIVESTATNGILSRTIRVVLKARFDAPPEPNGNHPLEGFGTTPISQSYFKQPIFGNSGITVSGAQVGPDSEGASTYEVLASDPSNTYGQTYSNYLLTLATNQLAQLSNGAKVTGDVTVTSSQSGTNSVVRSTADATVEGRVLSNGNSEGIAGYTDSGPVNVLSRADTPTTTPTPTSRLGANTDPVAAPANTSQYQLSPVSTPSTATNLAPLNTISTSPTAEGKTVFQTASLSTDGVPVSKPIDFSSSQPVQIYVSEGSDATAVNIDGSRIVAPTASGKFQIWYEGNKDVNINLNEASTSLSATIYAPNARVKISGPGTFKGALVGKYVELNSSNVLIDTSLGKDNPSGQGSPAGSLDSLTYKYRPGQGTVMQGWQPITWQEFGPGSGL